MFPASTLPGRYPVIHRQPYNAAVVIHVSVPEVPNQV